MLKFSRVILTVFLMAVIAILGVSSPASAQAPDEYYKGKTVRLIVGYGPGGGYDVYGRMIAPYIGKALGANVIVENMPGAGGIVALNRTMSSPPDGLQIMIVNGLGAALAQLTGQIGVRYDLGKISHLGTISASPWVWIVGENSPIKTAKQAITEKKRYMWAATGPIDGVSDGAAFSCAALRMECSIVFGYPGTNEAALAVAKGEMDMMYVSDTSANNYVKSGQNRALASMSRTKSRFFPDIPTIFDVADLKPEEAALFDFHSKLEDLGRILVAPPGIPDDRLAYLQHAVKTALSDPTLISDGEKSQRYIGYVDAETTRDATVSVVTQITPAEKARILRILSAAERK